MPTLSLLETRVLGVLIEKRHTVPDTYPLTLNALTAGCNQKSSRDPILEATDAQVQAALDELAVHSLVVESSGGRVMRYAENTGRVLAIPTQAVALVAILMLRGPQTLGELRINCERLHRFADLSAVEGFLNEMAQRETGALVVELQRAAGAREARWAHLLAGPPPDVAQFRAGTTNAPPDELVTIGELAALKANLYDAQRDIAGLREAIARLYRELGLPESGA